MELKKLNPQQLFGIICNEKVDKFHDECCDHIENKTLTTAEVINVTILMCARMLAMNTYILTEESQEQMFKHLKSSYQENIKNIEDIKNGN